MGHHSAKDYALSSDDVCRHHLRRLRQGGMCEYEGANNWFVNTAAGVAIHHYPRTQTMAALSADEVAQALLRLWVCCSSCGRAATKPAPTSQQRWALRQESLVRRATKYTQLCDIYGQDLVASCVVRLRTVPTKDRLPYLHATFLSLAPTRDLAALQYLESVVHR